MKNLKFIAISCLFLTQFAQASWIPKVDIKKIMTNKGDVALSAKQRAILNRDTLLAGLAFGITAASIYCGIKDKSIIIPAAGTVIGYNLLCASEKAQKENTALYASTNNGNIIYGKSTKEQDEFVVSNVEDKYKNFAQAMIKHGSNVKNTGLQALRDWNTFNSSDVAR